MRRLPQGRWTKTTATTTTTTLETPEQDEQQQQAQKPRKRPCALPTGQLTDRTDKPTNRPTEPNSNQRQRHNNPNQQRRPTTTDNRPVNRQTLSNSGYLVVPYGKFNRFCRSRPRGPLGNSTGFRKRWPVGLGRWAYYSLPISELERANHPAREPAPTGALIAHAWR